MSLNYCMQKVRVRFAKIPQKKYCAIFKYKKIQIDVQIRINNFDMSIILLRRKCDDIQLKIKH